MVSGGVIALAGNRDFSFPGASERLRKNHGAGSTPLFFGRGEMGGGGHGVQLFVHGKKGGVLWAGFPFPDSWGALWVYGKKGGGERS